MTARQPEQTEEETESLGSTVTRKVIMEVATGGMGSGLDHLMGVTPGTDVTGMTGNAVEDGSVLHHGPGEDGLLERPTGGYLAENSANMGTSIEHAGGGMSTIARNIDQAGTFSVEGHSIAVLDYVPGGNMVQAMGGNVDPGQMGIELVKMGAEHQGFNLSSEEGAPGRDESPFAHSGSDGAGEKKPGSRSSKAIDLDQGHSEQGDADEAAGTHGIYKGVNHGHIPDADENARDLEALALQHRMDLDTAVETSDTAHVHTQIHAHGRTLTVDTDYEARIADHDLEREDAADHARHIAHSANEEVDDDRDGVHFRSQIAAHLDAQARDEGISL